jgi:hypothetical protein
MTYVYLEPSDAKIVTWDFRDVTTFPDRVPLHRFASTSSAAFEYSQRHRRTGGRAPAALPLPVLYAQPYGHLHCAGVLRFCVRFPP